MIWLFALFLAGGLVFHSFIPQPSTPMVAASPTLKPSLTSQTILIEFNQYRQHRGLPTLQEDEALCELAKVRVEEVQTDWSHNGFYQRSQPFLSRHPYQRLGENLARAFDDPAQVIRAWDRSPEHQENLTYPYNRVCFAVSDDHIVQILGQP